MADFRPSMMWLLMGLVIVTFFAAGIGLVFAMMGTAYAPIDANTIGFYNKSNALNIQLEDIKGNTTSFKEKTNIYDRLGNFFSVGYSVLVSIPMSLDLLVDLTDQSLQDTNIEGSHLIKYLIVSIITILIFVGIILAILLKVGWI